MAKSDEGTDGKTDDTADDTGKGGSVDDNSSGSDGKSEQERLDYVAGKARSEGRTAGLQATLKGLGFDTEDEAKKFVKTKREADDKDKSELELLTSQVGSLTKRADDAEAETKSVKAGALTTKLQAAVKLEVVSNKELNINPEASDDVWLFIAKDYLGEDGIHIDENGKVQGIVKGLESLLKAKSYLASPPDGKKTPGSDTRQKKGKVDVKGEEIDASKTVPTFSRDRPNPRL